MHQYWKRPSLFSLSTSLAPAPPPFPHHRTQDNASLFPSLLVFLLSAQQVPFAQTRRNGDGKFYFISRKREIFSSSYLIVTTICWIADKYHPGNIIACRSLFVFYCSKYLMQYLPPVPHREKPVFTHFSSRVFDTSLFFVLYIPSKKYQFCDHYLYQKWNRIFIPRAFIFSSYSQKNWCCRLKERY
jgi:hypothetical protein